MGPQEVWQDAGGVTHAVREVEGKRSTNCGWPVEVVGMRVRDVDVIPVWPRQADDAPVTCERCLAGPHWAARLILTNKEAVL